MSARPVHSMEAALEEIVRLLDAGDVDGAKATARAGVELAPKARYPDAKPRYRDFEHAFNTACRKNSVRAAFFVMHFDDPESRTARMFTGGDSATCRCLDEIVAAGQHAIAEKH